MILGLLVVSSFWLLADSGPVQLDIRVTLNAPVTSPVPMNSFATISLTAEDISSTTITDETQGAKPTCEWTITVTPPTGSSYTRTGSGMNYIFREKLTNYGQWKFKAEAQVTCTSGDGQTFEGHGTSGEISVMAVAADVIEGPTVVNVGETANYTVSALPAGQTFPAGYPVWSINTQTLNTNFQSSGANASITPTARGEVRIYARCGTRPFILVKIVDGTQNPPPPNFPPGKYDETLGNIDLVAAPGNIRVPGISQLTATVRDRKGNPVSGVTVTILPAGSPQPGAATDAQGKTSFSVTPLVTTTYFATAPQYGIDSATVSVVPLGSPTIDLKAEKTTISRGESARLTITLKNSNGDLMGGHVQIKVGDVVRAELDVPADGPSIGLATYSDSPTQTTRYTAVHTANGTSISDSAQVRVIVPENVLSVSDRIWGKTLEDDDDTDNSPASPLAVGPKTLGKDADQLGRLAIELSDPGTAQFPWALHSKATGNPVVQNMQGIFNATTHSVDYDALAPGNQYYVEVTKVGDSAFKRRIDIDAPRVNIEVTPNITTVPEATEEDPGAGISGIGSTTLVAYPTGLVGTDGAVIYPRQLTWDNSDRVVVERVVDSNNQVVCQSPVSLAANDVRAEFRVRPTAQLTSADRVQFRLGVTGSQLHDVVVLRSPQVKLTVDGLTESLKKSEGMFVVINDNWDEQNHDIAGQLVPDNLPNYNASTHASAHRAVANDTQLRHGQLQLDAAGAWSLDWGSANTTLKVWRTVGSELQEVFRGQEFGVPDRCTIPLLFEGMQASASTGDTVVQARFQPFGGVPAEDSLKATVVQMRFGANEKTRPAPPGPSYILGRNAGIGELMATPISVVFSPNDLDSQADGHSNTSVKWTVASVEYRAAPDAAFGPPPQGLVAAAGFSSVSTQPGTSVASLPGRYAILMTTLPKEGEWKIGIRAESQGWPATGLCASGEVKISVDDIVVEILEVRSNQFAGQSVNRLLGHTGSVKEYMLMGGDSVVVKYRIFPDNAIAKSHVQIVTQCQPCTNGSALPADSNEVVVKVGALSTAVVGDPGVSDWAVGWMRDNDKVFLDTHFPIKWVSFDAYDWSVQVVLAKVGLATFTRLPYAQDLLNTFVNGGPAAALADQALPSSVSADAPWLDHNVGFVPAGQSGPVNKYVYGGTSTFSSKVSDHANLRSSVIASLVKHKQEVLAYKWTNGEATHTFPAWFDTIAVDFKPPGTDINVWGDAMDVHFAIGKADAWLLMRVEVEAGTLNVVKIQAMGQLDDLYDWDYTYDPHEARVQAGYDTLGACGHICRTEVVIGYVQSYLGSGSAPYSFK